MSEIVFVSFFAGKLLAQATFFMGSNLHCISDIGSKEKILFLHVAIWTEPFAVPMYHHFLSKSAGATDRKWPGQSFPMSLVVQWLFYPWDKHASGDHWMLPTLYLALLIVRNQFVLTDAPRLHILWKVTSLEKCFTSWLLSSCLAGAQRVEHLLSSWLTMGLRQGHCWLPLDKVRDLLPIWLPGFHSSAQGITWGATQFLLTEDELSQACGNPWKRNARFYALSWDKIWQQWQDFLLYSSLFYVYVFFLILVQSTYNIIWVSCVHSDLTFIYIRKCSSW